MRGEKKDINIELTDIKGELLVIVTEQSDIYIKKNDINAELLDID